MLLLSIHHDEARKKRAQPLLSLTLDGCETNSKSTTVAPRQIRPAFASRNDSWTRRPRPLESLADHCPSQSSTTISNTSSILPQHLIDEASSRKASLMAMNSLHSHPPKCSPPTKISEQAFSNKPLLSRQKVGSKQQHHQQQKHVTFSKIHIREHSITVGDHDWCEGSLPIQLDWQHTPTHSVDVDDYEWYRERQGRTPRGRLPKLDPSQRKRLLRRVAGITEEDLFLLERQHIDSKYVTQLWSKTTTLYHHGS